MMVIGDSDYDDEGCDEVMMVTIMVLMVMVMVLVLMVMRMAMMMMVLIRMVMIRSGSRMVFLEGGVVTIADLHFPAAFNTKLTPDNQQVIKTKQWKRNFSDEVSFEVQNICSAVLGV